jgi:hypothetical protein
MTEIKHDPANKECYRNIVCWSAHHTSEDCALSCSCLIEQKRLKARKLFHRLVHAFQSSTRLSALEEAISYIGQHQGWCRESEDMYRMHFGLPVKYTEIKTTAPE